MRRILTIAFLTLKAAVRFRLVLVMGALLVGAVIAVPLLIKDDGTARGFTQIVLTYTLTAITGLLGFVTLWLSCGTLAREIEECQLQMVVVKPIARWQIWLGKWLGIMLLNTAFLALSGAAVYSLLLYRARQLPPKEQQTLRNEVLVARGSLKEEIRDYEPIVEQEYQRRLRETQVPVSDRKLLKDQIREGVKAKLFQLVRPGFARPWVINLGWHKDRLRDQPLYLRFRFTVAQPGYMPGDNPRAYPTLWQVGAPNSPKVWRQELSLAADTFHEVKIPPNLFDDNGILTIICINPNDFAMLFLLENDLEVLYREGGFGLNFIRGLAVILCWLALLATLGLAAASFLSFPVAAFLSVGVLILGFSTGTLGQIIQEGGISGVNHDTGKIDTPRLIDQVAVPVASSLLKVINVVRDFSPIDSLSSGRSVSWGELTRAVLQIVLLMGGVFSVAGIILFTRRELATAQGNQ